MVRELTLTEARTHSAMFLYIFATDAYLNEISAKYAKIIRSKRANQRKLLVLSAQKHLNSNATYGDQHYNQYVTAIKEGFVDTYGITPLEALVKLALGEEVAGKNWNEGIYGVGALNVSTFNGTNVTVDPTNGHISKDGVDYTDETKTVYKEINKKATPYQLFATIENTTYMSQYNKTYKKYYAQTYSTDGSTFSARTGATVTSTSAGSVWENIQLGAWDFLEWIKTLLAFFGLNFGSSTTTTITESNTLPNQTADGYVQESGFSEAAAIALLAVAGGTMLAGGFFKKKNGNK